MRIDIRIDRVILTGLAVPAGASTAIRHALGAELTRMITAAPRHTWQQSRRRRRIGVPALRIGSPVDPADLGSGVANAIRCALINTNPGGSLKGTP